MPSPATRHPPRLDLGFLVFDGCMPSGLFAAADLARAANLRAGRELFRVAWASLDGRPVRAGEDGPRLQPTCAFADATCDAWLVPGLWAVSEATLLQAVEALAPEVAALRALPASTQLWAYCTGVALLARAGRLDGRAATATWWLRGALARGHARVRWRFDDLLVDDGGVRTACGPNGHLPLMAAALEARLSPQARRDVEDVLMLPRPREWMPVFRPVEMIAIADARLRRALAFAQGCPAQALTLEAAAARLGMSVRSFARLVQAGTGLAAGDWLRRAKLRQVGEALAASDEPVKAIVDRLGFGSEAGLYRAFQRTVGCTPAQFRQRFSARGASRSAAAPARPPAAPAPAPRSPGARIPASSRGSAR
jgi:transcriptional regulator GlxA family with amidase domain